MDRFVLVALACAALSACGEAACPAGSTSIGERCEPAPKCPPGEAMENGACVDAMGTDGDGGDVTNPDGLDGSITVDQDGSVMESNDPLCDRVECGAHGACHIARRLAVCVCDEGFDGARCDECADGFVSAGSACVDPCDANDAPDCGDFGECRSADGVAACSCDHPYAGEECGECDEGFSMRSGVCEPDCGECGEHASCNEALMTPSCECAAGYADDGSDCTWVGDGVTGGIVDGDLDDADAWTLTNMSVDAGVATFENVIVGESCKLGAIEQLIRMPAQQDAEPLVLAIEARTTCTSADPKMCPALLIDIGGTLTRVEVPGAAAPVERSLAICLGEAAYQEQVRLRVRPGLMTGAGTATCSATWPTLQRIAIRPATPDECPEAGKANGNLSGPSGWTLRGGAAINESRLTLNNSTAEATTLLAVPASGGIGLRVATTLPSSTEVLIDGLPFQKGTASSPTTICLPQWTFGSVHALGLESGGTALEITEISVEEDDGCAGQFDGGFEQPFGTGSWTYAALSAARFEDSGSRSGAYAWRVQSSLTGVVGLVLFPGYADEAQRPALAGWLRMAGTSMRGSVEIRVAGTAVPGLVTTSTAWGAKRLSCLGEEWAGQPALVVVAAIAESIGSGSSGTPTLWIDDLGPDLQPASNCD